MEIGQYLKRERETRSVSLDQVSTITKISPHHVLAIEEGKFDQLPGGVFVKGFLKSYAKAVGLSPDDVILRYENSLIKQEIKSEIAPKTKEPKKVSGVLIFVIVAVLVAGLAVFLSSR